MVTGSGVKTVSYYVNGYWEKPQGREMRPVMNPATGEVLAEVPMAIEDDVDRAVTTAHEAFLKWRNVPLFHPAQHQFNTGFGALEGKASILQVFDLLEHSALFFEA